MRGSERNTPSNVLNWLLTNCANTPIENCLHIPFLVGSHGYCSVSIKHRKLLAHRYVCEMFHGVPPSRGHQAAHSCGNKTCVNPHHLRWATRKENEADKRLHGTAAVGERNGASKLSASMVEEILQSKESTRALGAKYGVSSSTISRVRLRQSWGEYV